MTPTLSTKRLTLIPFRAGMVENWHVAWLNDPEVVQYSEQRHRRHTIESQHTFLNEYEGHIWLIQLELKGTNYYDDILYRDIGTITAAIDVPNRTANLGILIGEKNLWGKGYGLEAWNAVLRWCKEVGVKKAEAGCRADNEPMLSLLNKSMDWEAVVPSHFRDDCGSRIEAMLYGVTL